MQQLNLPYYHFRYRETDKGKYIFDTLRKRFVLLTSEEWVRQNFMSYLIREKNFPASLMAVERQILMNEQLFRFDLVAYNRSGSPLLIAEFKAPGVKVSQKAFDQVVRYNMVLKVKYVVVSNGMQHFACEIEYDNNSYRFLQEVPDFNNNP